MLFTLEPFVCAFGFIDQDLPEFTFSSVRYSESNTSVFLITIGHPVILVQRILPFGSGINSHEQVFNRCVVQSPAAFFTGNNCAWSNKYRHFVDGVTAVLKLP